jgi:FAD/FMN-containing dehydrogenase
MADISLAVIPPSDDLASEADRALARELAAEIEGEVRFGRHDRMLYATDASIYQVEPLGVAVPKTLADLRTIVEFAARHRLPLLPRGGGTSLAGQCVSRALVIDASKYLRAIIELDPASMMCRVEPGVVLDQLNAAAAKHGLRFGPDVATSSHATLGGMIGNNSAGAHSLVYGRTVEHVESLKVILADDAPCAFSSGPIDGRARDLAKGVAAIVGPLRDEIRARFPKTRRRVMRVRRHARSGGRGDAAARRSTQAARPHDHRLQQRR